MAWEPDHRHMTAWRLGDAVGKVEGGDNVRGKGGAEGERDGGETGEG